jgi:superfamily II DNA/RNA helicase
MPDVSAPSRDELASRYLDQLPFEPYPVQEEALLAWFTAEEGVLVCAPTGTGKTLIAEAALFESLHNRRVAYYTTPLIALTEQKFREMQDAAERWGFSRDDVGLVTGHRCVNRDATVRVVVAEILLNRLLHPEAFDFSDVAAVVMDEFHSFNDPERGIVWELSLGLLPPHVRLLLLSATVGNSAEFLIWLRNAHGRRVQLIQSTERKVPLRYEWVGDGLLNEQLEHMAEGDETRRRTPALVFCFNREQCWSVAEQLRGKSLLADGQQGRLQAEIEKHDWTKGAGPKLKSILLRGVGVHHAGMLPRYRRMVEHLFQRKLLSVCVCTETLAAGINLPARSVVLTTLLKGPPGKKRLIDASSAHQMFGRAGRPQFDIEGYVYALAHEDDVKIARWQEKHGTIPPNTKDPNVLKAYKRLQKKAPTRRKTEQYWNEEQFQKLIAAPPARLASRGPFPWRLLAYLLTLSPEVERLRTAARKRLMDEKRIVAGQKTLTRMLITLWAGGYVTLDPEPPDHMRPKRGAVADAPPAGAGHATAEQPAPAEPARPSGGTLGALLQEARAERPKREAVVGRSPGKSKHPENAGGPGDDTDDDTPDIYQPDRACPTETLARLLVFRSVNPLYGDFLVRQLGIADRAERIQAFESVLDVPGSMAKHLRVPKYENMPPGELAKNRLDTELIQRGLVTPQDLVPKEGRDLTWEERWVPTLAEKLRLLFESEFPGAGELRVTPVWAAGDLLDLGGDFNQYVTSRGLTKQEGMVFRHLLRLILLCGEFAQLNPPETMADEWHGFLDELTGRLTESCRAVDPESTDKAIEAARATADVIAGEATATDAPPPEAPESELDEFGSGLFE